MLLLRLLGVLVLIVVAVSVVMYLVTREPRYIYFAWRFFRYSIFIALAFFALLALERIALIAL